MNIAGPSRPRPGRLGLPQERVQSTYEADLLGLLDQLGVDEMDEMQTHFARRASTGVLLSDHDIAMNNLLQEARALAVINEDRALALQIASGPGEVVRVGQTLAVPPPRATAAALLEDEDRTATWVATAAQPENGDGTATRRSGNRVQAARNNTAPIQKWKRWLSSIVGRALGSKVASQPPTTADTIVTPRVNRPTGHDCVICQDPIYGAEIRAPCGHYYDTGCITDLFQSATRDETLYPPRCCRQNIPFARVQPHLSQELITAFQQKQVEFGTLKRVYCSSPTCSLFLGPLAEGIPGQVYTCPAPGCGRQTCARCRESYNNRTHVCRPDADAAQVLELSRNSGWARCPGCSQMIELHFGCYHMTCRCRTEFCYLCRARWKTCACPQWDDRRLLAAAEERVDAQLGAGREQVRRDVPALPPRRVPVPAPVPVPARRLRVPLDESNVIGNLGQAVPPPLPARRVQRPGSLGAPLPPTRTVQPPRAQPAPSTLTAAVSTSNTTGHSGWSRTAAASTSKNLFPSTSSSSASASTSSRGLASPASTSRNPFASASTHASASTSTSTSAFSSRPTNRPKSTHGSIDTVRQRLVHQMMERLRVDHDCNHSRWLYRRGGGICQTCEQYLPIYLFRCQGCELLVCNRCRRNRL